MMKYLLFLIGLCLATFHGKGQLRIEITENSTSPIPGGPLYLATDYDHWNPANPYHKLKRDRAGVYYILLDSVPATFHYKFTQGSWALVEGCPENKVRANRVYDRFAERNPDLVQVSIDGWEKKISYTFVVRSLPANTPKSSSLYITGNFNGWNLQDPLFKLNRWSDDTWRVSINTELDTIEYKFSRGDHASLEVYTSDISDGNRKVSRTSVVDNTYIAADIKKWKDIPDAAQTLQWSNLFIACFVLVGLLLVLSISSKRYFPKQSSRWFLVYPGLMIMASLTLSLLKDFLSLDVSPISHFIIDAVWLLFAIILYMAGNVAIQKPENFTPAHSRLKSKPMEGTSESGSAKRTSDELLLDNLKDKVDRYIRTHKSYTNPELNLNDLAAKIKIPSRTLSEVINKKFGVSFFEFINSYRIEEFKRMADDPDFKHYRLLALALDAGFNSKSAFNRAFKKITRQTPSEYFNTRSKDTAISP